MGEVKKPTDKGTKNMVHENAILVETIRKELREQRLYENFSINPFIKRKYPKNILIYSSDKVNILIIISKVKY